MILLIVGFVIGFFVGGGWILSGDCDCCKCDEES